MTDESRGPRGLFRKGQGGNLETRFKTGDPDNPRTRQKRGRDARGKTIGAKQELKREEMRAELVALDVLERLLSRSRQTTAPRLPRLPHGPNARREADRLAARSMTRSLRSMQRIARDPDEAPDVRVAVARLLLERGGAGIADILTRGTKSGADGEKKAPKVIVVSTNVPRSPSKIAAQQEAARAHGGTASPLPMLGSDADAPARPSTPSIPESDMPAAPAHRDPGPDSFVRPLSPALPMRRRQEVAENED